MPLSMCSNRVYAEISTHSHCVAHPAKRSAENLPQGSNPYLESTLYIPPDPGRLDNLQRVLHTGLEVEMLIAEVGTSFASLRAPKAQATAIVDLTSELPEIAFRTNHGSAM